MASITVLDLFLITLLGFSLFVLILGVSQALHLLILRLRRERVSHVRGSVPAAGGPPSIQSLRRMESPSSLQTTTVAQVASGFQNYSVPIPASHFQSGTQGRVNWEAPVYLSLQTARTSSDKSSSLPSMKPKAKSLIPTGSRGTATLLLLAGTSLLLGLFLLRERWKS